MSSHDQPASQTDMTSQVRVVLQEAKLDDNENIEETPGWHDMLLEALDSYDLSPSELHRKRKRLTFQAFQDPSKVIATERLVEPNSRRIHVLFSRSEMIASLHQLPPAMKDERAKLQSK